MPAPDEGPSPAGPGAVLDGGTGTEDEATTGDVLLAP
jgi:hypothetical protein